MAFKHIVQKKESRWAMSSPNIILYEPVPLDFNAKHKNTAQTRGNFIDIYDSQGNLIFSGLYKNDWPNSRWQNSHQDWF